MNRMRSAVAAATALQGASRKCFKALRASANEKVGEVNSVGGRTATLFGRGKDEESGNCRGDVSGFRRRHTGGGEWTIGGRTGEQFFRAAGLGQALGLLDVA